MLRSRFRSLRPQEKRALRHWALEFMVVVVGVLLALLAAEWAETRRAKAEAEQAVDAMARELQMISSVDSSLTRFSGYDHTPDFEDDYGPKIDSRTIDFSSLLRGVNIVDWP